MALHLRRLRRVWVVDAPADWLRLPALLSDPGWRAGWASQGRTERCDTLRRLLGAPRVGAVTSAEVARHALEQAWAASAPRYTWRPAEGGWVRS